MSAIYIKVNNKELTNVAVLAKYTGGNIFFFHFFSAYKYIFIGFLKKFGKAHVRERVNSKFGNHWFTSLWSHSAFTLFLMNRRYSLSLAPLFFSPFLIVFCPAICSWRDVFCFARNIFVFFRCNLFLYFVFPAEKHLQRVSFFCYWSLLVRDFNCLVI